MNTKLNEMGIIGSDYTVTSESFDSLTSYWLKRQFSLKWNCIFVLPPWLEAWWKAFDSNGDLYLCAVRERKTIIGVAPLLLGEDEVYFMGSSDVCDCLDFVVALKSERAFFNILLDDLKQKGIKRLSLRPLRPDSTVLTHLVRVAEERGYDISCKMEDISLELELPPTWEEYLGMLNRKQRHEVRRKLRRLREAGRVSYRTIEDSEGITTAIDLFFELFRKSRSDKSEFMNTHMESFFRSLAEAAARAHILRIGILELDANPVATTMCFDYDNTVYLYNNGYDPQYGSISVGLTSKILCIKDSIERGRRKFDFLKGNEEYKYRLGGKEVSLYGCQIVLG